MTENDDIRIAYMHETMLKWDETGCPWGRVLNARFKASVAVAIAFTGVMLIPWLAWLTVKVTDGEVHLHTDAGMSVSAQP